MFQQTQDKEYLDVITKRMKDENTLDWVNQFYDIIKSENMIENKSINDIGCQIGQFYKKIRYEKMDYFGYDIEKQYLDIFKSYFVECSKNVFELDVSKEKPRVSDITITSATIEHIENIDKAFENIFKSTKKMCIIRTLAGEESKKNMLKKENAQFPYLIKQFSFKELYCVFNKYGFNVTTIKDKRTDSIPQLIGFDVCNEPIIRTQYVFKLMK